MDPTTLLGVLYAVGAGVVAPGIVWTRGLRLGRGALERSVLVLALGSLSLSCAALLAAATAGSAALHGFAITSSIGAAWLLWRGPAPAPQIGKPTSRVATTVAIAAALLLVIGVVGTQGLPDAGGDLRFAGRDAANDPLFYAAVALDLHANGPPLVNPFAGGEPTPGSYGPFAALSGLHELSRVPMLDVATRLVPMLDCVALTLAVLAFVRALGGSGIVGVGAAVLLWFGGGLGGLLPILDGVASLRVQPLDSWALFGSALLPFNPIGRGLLVFLAAGLLVPAFRPGRLREPIVAGLLVASLLETKLFLYGPVVAGLGLLALRPPAGAPRVPIRIALASALAFSVPSLVEKLYRAFHATSDETGLRLCVGCLPRYFADASLGSHDLSFASFERFRSAQLLDPAFLVESAFAAIFLAVLGLGVRWLALPEIRRRWSIAPARWLALASGVGLAAAIGLGVRPHQLNAAQFAWIACAGAWLFLALALERWRRDRRWLPLLVALPLTAAGVLDTLVHLGRSAQSSFEVAGADREAAARVAALVHGDEVIFEPSMLVDTDRPSVFPPFAGRRVHLSLLSAVATLPAAERDRRFDQLVRVYVERDPAPARAALAESGADWLWLPRNASLPDGLAAELPVSLSSEAGTLFSLDTLEPPGSSARD